MSKPKLRFTPASMINYERFTKRSMIKDLNEMKNTSHMVASLIEPTSWEHFNELMEEGNEVFDSMFENGTYVEGMTILGQSLKG